MKEHSLFTFVGKNTRKLHKTFLRQAMNLKDKRSFGKKEFGGNYALVFERIIRNAHFLTSETVLIMPFFEPCS